MRPPSGEQHELRHGDATAVVVEVGAGLRTYTTGGRAVVDGYGVGEICSGGRGQLLLPWPNRIRDGLYAFNGASYQLALTEPSKRNAIHGLVRWANWQAVERGDGRVVLALELHPQPGYSFALALRVEYELGDRGLEVTTGATNIGTGPCPYGAGAHPYLTAGTATIDTASLHVPAAIRVIADERGIPTGTEPIAGAPYDFRAPRELGSTVLDTCFAELERDDEGDAVVTLGAPDGAGVAVRLGEAYEYVMVFTGDTLPPATRRRGIAIEPMTCAPNAFNSGAGLKVLEPGESTTARFAIEPLAP